MFFYIDVLLKDKQLNNKTTKQQDNKTTRQQNNQTTNYVWKTIPSKARVTRDTVSGYMKTYIQLSGRKYQKAE